MIICRGMSRDEMKRKILTYLLWFSPSQEYFVILFSGSPYGTQFHRLCGHTRRPGFLSFLPKGTSALNMLAFITSLGLALLLPCFSLSVSFIVVRHKERVPHYLVNGHQYLSVHITSPSTSCFPFALAMKLCLS